MGKSRVVYRWYVKFPGDAYALGPLPEYHATEREARAYVRDWLKLDRLPRGAELWPSEYSKIEGGRHAR